MFNSSAPCHEPRSSGSRARTSLWQTEGEKRNRTSLDRRVGQIGPTTGAGLGRRVVVWLQEHAWPGVQMDPAVSRCRSGCSSFGGCNSSVALLVFILFM